jgi:hypothetical protein
MPSSRADGQVERIVVGIGQTSGRVSGRASGDAKSSRLFRGRHVEQREALFTGGRGKTVVERDDFE